MTNAEQIREMSDWELAEWLCSKMGRDACEELCPARHICYVTGNGLQEWMKMEAKEDDFAL